MFIVLDICFLEDRSSNYTLIYVCSIFKYSINDLFSLR